METLFRYFDVTYQYIFYQKEDHKQSKIFLKSLEFGVWYLKELHGAYKGILISALSFYKMSFNGRVLVYGGKGALGANIVHFFKGKNWVLFQHYHKKLMIMPCN